jgi:hypothetical protein
MKILIVLTLFTFLACAQPKGTINGHPIDDAGFIEPKRAGIERELQMKLHHPPSSDDVDAAVQAYRCNRLREVIDGMLREEQAKHLAISVTSADMEAARHRFMDPDPSRNYNMEPPEVTYKRNLATNQALLAALEAVDKGEDPKAVQERLLKSYLPLETFQMMIPTYKIGTNREKLKKAANTTWEQFQQQVAQNKEAMTTNTDWKRMATYDKLNQAVDEQLALSDPKFAKALETSKIPQEQQNRPGATYLTGDQYNYLNQQRAAYWDKVRSQAQIFINDPTMQSCVVGAVNGGGSKPR